METERILVISVVIAGFTVVAGVVFNVVLAAVARFRAQSQPGHAAPGDVLLDSRLARIEIAVESIALEVERLGELQRFNAKLDAQRLPEPRPVARPVTPH